MDLPMKLVAILVFLVHSHATFCSTVEAKRYDHNMVDPLTRRSALDKNFMRFGRSSGSQDSVHDNVADTSSDADDIVKRQDDFLRDKDNFIRFGRDRHDNFIRFGRDRSNQNFIRFGRDRSNNFMRFGRGRNENFIRFGRDNQESIPKDDLNETYDEKQLDINSPEDKRKTNFLRFGRGRHENFIRFGRSPAEEEPEEENSGDENEIPLSMRSGGSRGQNNKNFLRSGRRRQDNFIRFGRAGNDRNFMRFGRAGNDRNFMRFGRAGNDRNFMRFGKAGNDRNFMRFGRAGNDRNFMRFGRAGDRNFMRFGRSDAPEEDDTFSHLEKNTIPVDSNEDGFIRFGRDKDLLRWGRQLPSDKGDGFIRFGRNVEKKEDNDSSTERIKRSLTDTNKNRAKRSVLEEVSPDQVYTDLNFDDEDERNPEIVKTITRSYFPVDLEDEYETAMHRQDIWNRKKRSLKENVNTESPEPLTIVGNDIPLQLTDNQIPYDVSPLDYYPSPLSAGIPNFIVGPEFSLLPPLDVSTSKFKKGRPGDRNFIRLG